MRELKEDLAAIASIFQAEDAGGYVFVKVDPCDADAVADRLGVAVRRCYLPDLKLKAKSRQPGVSRSDLVRSKLPDPGPVMSGDFGEILTAFFQASEELPILVVDPKKWRLKQDRRKAAPYSDVVQFVLPKWDDQTGTGASEHDNLLCAEVKTKATAGTFNPIAKALADSKKDREGRLVDTLLWLRDRAVADGLGTMSIQQIDRFLTNAVDSPPFQRRFRAVAVICASLAKKEIADNSTVIREARESALVVITVPDLKARYEAAYDQALLSVSGSDGDRND